jgi:hypothetical protein
MTVETRSVPERAPRVMPGRSDWWVYPVTTAVVFTLFVVYAFWSVVTATNFAAGPYLSPFYSPVIKLGWWPFSSAFLVAWVPLAFRATCYYYRKAYYRAYFWDPPACAIREPGHPHVFSHEFVGERRFPWVLNNFHRYFLYLALIVLGFLWWDTISSFWYAGHFYLGFGSVLMLVNVLLLTGYTFSCHALRHLVGGNVDCFSCVRGGGARRGMWRFVSFINPYHGNWAWFSLFSVMATDLYIRLVAGGTFGSGCFTHGHFGC